jgi:cyanophycinase
MNIFTFRQLLRIAAISFIFDLPSLAQPVDIESLQREGVLVISGSNEPNIDAVERFFRLFPHGSRLVVVASPGQESTVRRFAKMFSGSSAAELRVVKSITQLDHGADGFDGAWIADLPTQKELDACQLDDIMKLVENGASIGISRRVAEHVYDATAKPKSLQHTLTTGELRSPYRVRLAFSQPSDDFVPSVEDERLAIRLHNQTQLVVSDRWIWSYGEPAKIHLPPSDAWNESELDLTSRPRDLVALQRSVRARLFERPTKAAARVVESGTLLLVGGGRIPDELMIRFVKLAGGKSAHIVVLPTAVPDPIPKRQWIATAFKEFGAARVTVLPERLHAEIELDRYLKTMEDATGIWFGGGRQWRFVDAYEGTKALDSMREVLRRGGIIGGSSAGASIQAEYLARGNPLGNWNIMAEGYERGFGFLPGVAVDQHFSQRSRLPELRSLIAKHPTFLGIGLDEGTGIFVANNIAEVVGDGDAYFVSAPPVEVDSDDSERNTANADEDSPSVLSLQSGESIDLVRLEQVGTADHAASPENDATNRP